MALLSKLSVPLAAMALSQGDFAHADCPIGAINCNGFTLDADHAVGGARSRFKGLLFNTALFLKKTYSTCPDWRTITGRCNNVVFKDWGTVGEEMPRSVSTGESTTNAGITPDVYDDQRWTDYGGTHSGQSWGGYDPRYVSDKVCRVVDDWTNDGGGAGSVENDDTRSDAVITYAQVMDHELDATGPIGEKEGNLNAVDNSGEEYEFGKDTNGNIFPGGISGKLERTNNLAKNGITSYVDAGIVYGESENERQRLRKGHGLKYTCLEQSNIHDPCGVGAQYLPTSKDICNSSDSSCTTDEMFMANPTKRSCFYAGDFRANENPALLAFHTLFARMHNFMDGKNWECECGYPEDEIDDPHSKPGFPPRRRHLASLNVNGAFDGAFGNKSTCRFETIRHRVGYEEQFITYNEWLPAYTGTWSGGSYSEGSTTALTFSTTGVGGMPAYGVYNTAIRGSVRHIFATATFRQHTGVNHTMKLASAGDLELDQTYFESCVWVGNTGPGCSSQQATDKANDSDVTSHGIKNLCEIMVGQVQQLAKRGDTVMLTEQRNQLFYKASGFGNTKEDSNGNVRPNGEGNDGACLDANNPATCNTASHNGTIEGIGGDLATLNMFRGRDHEIAGYKDAFNAYFSVSAPASPGDIHNYDGLVGQGSNANPAAYAGTVNLSDGYGSDMDAVDLWTGALGEAKLGNSGTGNGVSMLGAILTFDVVTQFRDLRDGDRFYRENKALSGYPAPAFCETAGGTGGLGLKHWISELTGAAGLGLKNAFKVNDAAGCEEARGETKVNNLFNADKKCGSGIKGNNPGYKGSGEGGGEVVVGGGGDGDRDRDDDNDNTLETHQ